MSADTRSTRRNIVNEAVVNGNKKWPCPVQGPRDATGDGKPRNLEGKGPGTSPSPKTLPIGRWVDALKCGDRPTDFSGDSNEE